jgi:WD40 repeat protein
MRAIAFGALLAASLAAPAAEPPTAPLLRVEPGSHAGLIRRVVVDAPRQRLVTCADDKTIRVWQLPEGRLVATLYVPIDSGHEGQLFALALSPDGRTVAAGGWTGWDWERAGSVYLYDLASGEMTRRLGGLPDAIASVAFTPDGRHLVVGLQGRAGLRVLRLADGAVVAADEEYDDKLMEIDIARDGRVATVALDGFARLYTPEFAIHARRRVPGGRSPVAVRFSPDGEELAVGFADAPAVAVLSGQDLAARFRVAADGPREKSLVAVAWSSDGRRLYAAGDQVGVGPAALFRWENRGRGERARIPVGSQRINDLAALPDGAIVYATEDPALGVVSAAGERRLLARPAALDFSAAQDRLFVSADASAVRYPTGPGAAEHRTFSIAAPGRGPVRTNAPALHRASGSAPGIAISDWKGSFAPRLNGKPLQLDDYERAYHYALARDGRIAVLATEWAVRAYDRGANLLWKTRLAAVAWAVNVSPDGRYAVAALSDGTIRWYRMADGEETAAFFPHANGEDWIAWVPLGHYVSSRYGDRHVGWLINRGKDAAPDFFRAVQFERVLYRPDVVAEWFRSAGAKRGAPFLDAQRLAAIAPPRIRATVLGVADGADGRPRARVRIAARALGPPMRDLSVFVNSIPVISGRERLLGEPERAGFTRELELELPEAVNEVRIESFTGVSMGLAETVVRLPQTARVESVRGELYVLAVGVSRFPNLPPDLQLAYAARDAEEFARRLGAAAGKSFRRVHAKVVSDAGDVAPDRASILAALELLQSAQAPDTVVLFLASHGLSDRQGNYLFVPRDAQAADFKAVAAPGTPTTLIPWEAFFDALRGAAGRRVLIVDTCRAKGIAGRFDPASLIKRSASSLFALLVASGEKEESQEYDPGGHGLFTYALLAALSERSDADRDGRVTLAEWFGAARPVVEKLRDRTIGPQTPHLSAPPPLDRLVVLETAGKRVPGVAESPR